MKKRTIHTMSSSNGEIVRLRPFRATYRVSAGVLSGNLVLTALLGLDGIEHCRHLADSGIGHMGENVAIKMNRATLRA